jgi:hypothetical protein
MSYDRKYLVLSLVYAALGMCLGIYMAASHNHGQHVTHAHILLVGFVVSLIYGVIHKLWLGQAGPMLARAQFIVHHAGAITMFAGLFLLYGNFMPGPQIEPILAVASLAVLLGVLLMLLMVLRSGAPRK